MDVKFQAIYKGKNYEFDDGLVVYMFEKGIQYEIDVNYGKSALKKYAEKTAECIINDRNEPQIEKFAKFMADCWDIVCDMDCYELLDYYYLEYCDE